MKIGHVAAGIASLGATATAFWYFYSSGKSTVLCTPRGFGVATATVSTASTARSQPAEGQRMESSMADGCYHVFVDAGSNKGVHGRFLFEPEQYPNATKITSLFDKYLGPGVERRKSTCVFAFEPNPRHKEHQSATQEAYALMGWRYYFMPMGVGARNATLPFYRNALSTQGDKKEDWAFGILNLDAVRVHAKKVKAVKVPVLDFGEWFDRMVLQRKIPKEDIPASWGKPTTVIKMDIEGAEFATLTHMLARGILCKVDFLFGESHGRFGEFALPASNISVGYKKAERLLSYINTILDGDGCPTIFNHIDEEKYLHDGVEYPVPP